MDTSKVISTDKATVVIQVNPQVTQNTVSGDDEQETRGEYGNTALAEFFKARPKALGTVQIMNGVVIFLSGIVRTTFKLYMYQLSINSGLTFLGSLVYIAAGSLSIAAQNKLHLCVVKASLIMNVLSAITAVIVILLLFMEIDYNNRYDLGIRGILLVFTITQFIISLCISGFACKATYNSDSTVVSVVLNQPY